MKILARLFALTCLLFLLSPTQAQNLTLASTYTWSGTGCNDIWGYADAAGNEYALVGLVDGISIVNVTNPFAPFEIYYIDEPNSIWRDLRYYNGYVYAVDDQGGSGMIIIDMTNPSNISHTYWTTTGGGNSNFTRCHNIFIDEFGYAFLYGCNNGVPTSQKGAIMLDLNTNPTNPQFVGFYNQNYIHDAYVKNNIMWAAEIYQGHVAVVDVSNKSNPVVLATVNTPDNFTHNCWVNDTGDVLFTTDEVSGAYVGVYDVSDLSNITELDRVQSNPGTNVIPHNTFCVGDFIITSYYTDGVIIHDATRPDNVIKIGAYDTAPNYSGSQFEGCWGVHPYLPSGVVLASDQQTDLNILIPNYLQACYLEGTVYSATTGQSIFNVDVSINGQSPLISTDFSGEYKTGMAAAGTYTVTYSAFGYQSQTITVTMNNGVLNLQDIYLAPNGYNDIRVTCSSKLGGAGTGTLMNDDLRQLGLIPNQEPYTALGFSHVGGGGGETVSNAVLNVTGGNAIVDWVILELRNRNNPAMVMATRSALIQRDGDIVDMDGTSAPLFQNVSQDYYYVAVRHRNHLGVMTDATINLQGGANSNYDFTSTANTSYGTNAMRLVGGSYVQWPGNGNMNGSTIYQGNGSDILPITQAVYNNPANSAFQSSYPYDAYDIADYNMDGQVIYQGSGSDILPITQSVFTNPANSAFQVTYPIAEQLP